MHILYRQLDFDADGDLDLLVKGKTEIELWAWEGEARRYALAETIGTGSPLAPDGVVDLDGDGHPDLLVNDGKGGVEARLFGVRGRGRPWATAMAGALLGLDEVRARTVLTGLDSTRVLIIADRRDGGSTIYPVGRLTLGPARRGPVLPDDGEDYGLAAGDLDLDGATDLIYMHRDRHQPPHRLLLRRPTLGGWRLLRDVPGLDLSTDDQDVILDDVDQDGDLDVLALNGNELAGLPPDGCCRLFLSDAADHALRLAVDVAPGGLPFVGAEVELAGSARGPVQLTGGHLLGAALFGLGAGGVPGSLTVRWPDGSSETVRDRERFVADDHGWRVRLSRGAQVAGRLLVGRWIVDLAAPPEQRVKPASGLSDGAVEAWTTPNGVAVWEGDARTLVHIDREGAATQAPVPGTGCSWGGYVGGGLDALLLSCTETREDGSDERYHLWRPGDRALSSPIEGAPPYSRGMALDGDRLWIAWGRRRVEARAAGPGLAPLGISLSAPPGSVDRTFVFVTPDRQVLILDEGADRVEVWSGEPLTLQRLIPVGDALDPPAWDPSRQAWLVPVAGGVDVVDPDRDEPTARWEVSGLVGGALPLEGGTIAVLTRGTATAVTVLAEPGAPPLMTVSLPPMRGRVFELIEE